jgi:hypothetical protein
MTSQYQGWRDIASAPRDGGSLLVCWDDGDDVDAQAVAYFDEITGDWMVMWNAVQDPTHWMPLPEPPCSPSPRTGESDGHPSA